MPFLSHHFISSKITFFKNYLPQIAAKIVSCPRFVYAKYEGLVSVCNTEFYQIKFSGERRTKKSHKCFYLHCQIETVFQLLQTVFMKYSMLLTLHLCRLSVEATCLEKQLLANDTDDAVVISSLPPCTFSITSLLAIILFCL